MARPGVPAGAAAPPGTTDRAAAGPAAAAVAELLAVAVEGLPEATAEVGVGIGGCWSATATSEAVEPEGGGEGGTKPRCGRRT